MKRRMIREGAVKETPFFGVGHEVRVCSSIDTVVQNALTDTYCLNNKKNEDKELKLS